MKYIVALVTVAAMFAGSLNGFAVDNNGLRKIRAARSLTLRSRYAQGTTSVLRYQDGVDQVAPIAPGEPTPMLQGSVIEGQPMMAAPMMAAPMGNYGCSSCCNTPCCCPPPCVPMKICLVDPCGCPYEACVKVPACCVGQAPQVSWRNGIFGRQIATLCWSCCDHESKVVITGSGKVRVRG